ncbi:hypothetical protein EKD04_005710 [Chloroflexales bacterium ZM16-3]|nr:hypothetical protein [Chloroflexales bacterium ZM16-3]
MLLPLLPWGRDEPLTSQLDRVGLGWQLLSADYDLNGDQIADLIGVLDYGGVRTPWAWLSAEDQYRPLFAPQGYPLGSTGTEQGYEYRDYQHYQDVRVSDLDANGRPELLLVATQELVLMEWAGDRFRIQREELDPSPLMTPFTEQGRAEEVLAEPQADGSSRLRARMIDAQGQALGSWIYALQDGELRRIEPPVEDPVEVSRLIEVLFGADEPRRALQMLADFAPVEPANGYQREFYLAWQQEAADYLRGLALAYTGDAGSSQEIWRGLAQRSPDSVWAPLAGEKLP